MTLYEVVYRQAPPTMLSYILESTNVHQLEEELKDRDCILCLLKENLHMAYARMKQQVDKHRSIRGRTNGSRLYPSPVEEKSLHGLC